MARKPALSIDKLKDLGAGTLARLVLVEAERNAGFRRQVKTALAGKDGPEAIAVSYTHLTLPTNREV